MPLVEYSDSEAEEEQPVERREQRGESGRGTGAAARPVALPGAAALLGGSGLPPPDFGDGAGGGGIGYAAAAGTKRAHPDTRGPLPNPMSLDTKLPRRCLLPVVSACCGEVLGQG